MIGIFSWFGIDLPFEQRIKLIKKAGFDATSIWLGDEEKSCISDDFASIVHQNNLYLENAHAPYNKANLLWNRNSVNHAIDEYSKCIEYCSKNRIEILVIHPSKGNYKIENNECGLDALSVLTTFGKKNNVRIAVENTRQNHILDLIFENLNDIYFCFDSSHDNLYSEKKFALLTKFSDRLICVHLSDNHGIKDDHILPFEGVIDWDLFVDYLPKKFAGVYNLEVVDNKKNSPDEFLLAARSRIELIKKQIIRKNKLG
ncbi:MAG: sugar phosphate isomerase/epimerase [Candidatus Delongbacteria bacterium]|nr:sugar phosphate isomerase/epimerase [Candidatus Delongbacteria bacterium]MBN2835274.1 sugar phosphate isomerase/epimerase [Candidatus Delongbacteria bacterium]